MSDNLQPSFANGKICYLEIPALDVQQSSGFYQKVFGWNIREDNEGNISFDDTTGQVSGMWIKGAKVASEPGVEVSIMVASMSETIQLIKENNGTMVDAPGENVNEVIARFADPAGNVFCLYQHSV